MKTLGHRHRHRKIPLAFQQVPAMVLEVPYKPPSLSVHADFLHIFFCRCYQATMICIDNSEWMRNGDYSPSRFQAQADAINLICGAKTQSNPENTVGILTMAGKGVRVLVTPTSDLGKILACMHGLEVGGEMNMPAGIQIAHPIRYDKKVLETIGKKLKKNSVALDIVYFGEEDGDKPEKLAALLCAVNNNDSSHIVHVPPGPNALSDVLISTPVFTGDGEGGTGYVAAAAAAAAGNAAGFDFGVDPNLDPELAMALRISMEEERARQEEAARKASEDASGQHRDEEHVSSSQDAIMTESPEEDMVMLEKALAMSVDEPGSSQSGNEQIADKDMSESIMEDKELVADNVKARELRELIDMVAPDTTIRMSVHDNANDLSTQNEMDQVLSDKSFVSSILSTLPGVDPNDPSVKDLLESLHGESKGGFCRSEGADITVGNVSTSLSHLRC
ncbi:hypothetical protein ACLOJK_025678 [Asimina triloba]